MGARLPPVTVMVCFFFAMSTRVVVGLSRVGSRRLGTVRSNCFAAASTARFFSNDAAASLPFEDNRHNSIMIKVRPDADASFDESTFEGSLLATEKAALHLGKTAVWIEVPILQSRFIELAANCGFVFHHAEGDQASLCKWIDTEHTSRIPCFATHQVGVGAVVISSNQILCVRELRKNYRRKSFVPEYFLCANSSVHETIQRTNCRPGWLNWGRTWTKQLSGRFLKRQVSTLFLRVYWESGTRTIFSSGEVTSSLYAGCRRCLIMTAHCPNQCHNRARSRMRAGYPLMNTGTWSIQTMIMCGIQ